MTMTEAVHSVLTKYATFRGRAPRSEYWFFYLATVVASLAANVVDAAIGAPVIGIVISLAVLVPTIAVSVRRLHDSNLSGLWLLVPYATAALAMAALLAFVVSSWSDDEAGMASPATVALGLAAVVALLVSAVITIYLMCRPSTPGPNRFGDPASTLR